MGFKETILLNKFHIWFDFLLVKSACLDNTTFLGSCPFLFCPKPLSAATGRQAMPIRGVRLFDSEMVIFFGKIEHTTSLFNYVQLLL